MIRTSLTFLVLAAAACASSTAPPPAAPAPGAASKDACYDRFVDYCPDPGDGAKTCTDAHGDTHDLTPCAGHCAGTQCILGDASCDTRPIEGAPCSGAAKCAYASRMGILTLACNHGRWASAHAGI